MHAKPQSYKFVCDLRHKEGSSDVVMQARRYLSCATVASVLVLIASVQGAGAVACGTGTVAANEAFAADEYDRCHSIAVGSNGVTVHLLWKVSGRETADETVTIAAQFPSDQVSYFVCSMSQNGKWGGTKISTDDGVCFCVC